MAPLLTQSQNQIQFIGLEDLPNIAPSDFISQYSPPSWGFRLAFPSAWSILPLVKQVANSSTYFKSLLKCHLISKTYVSNQTSLPTPPRHCQFCNPAEFFSLFNPANYLLTHYKIGIFLTFMVLSLFTSAKRQAPRFSDLFIDSILNT